MSQSTNLPARHWIDGKWTESARLGESVDPSTGAVVGAFYDGGEAEARAAVDAAADAFASTGWARDHSARAIALERLADALAARVPEMAATLSRENGKLLRETTWEVGGAATWLRYAAASARTQIAGRAAEVAPGQYFRSTPEPAGVVGVISPWNSPVLLTVRALGPALAAGCAVVVKLPAQTALTNELFAQAVAAVEEIPAGVVNIVTESGSEVARHLVASERVDVLSYTGSTPVGKVIAASAATTLKRVGLELGGKTPLVLFPSADLDRAIPDLLRAITLMNGQFCCTGSRVLVHRDIADRVRAALTEALPRLRLGAWDDDEADLGPLIDRASAERVDAIVEEAASYGEVLVRGGQVTEGPLSSSGAFYRPSLVEVADTDARIVQEEVFGPVQTFEVFDDEADAVRKANATPYGLAASIFTGDPAQARRVGRQVRSGVVWTNTWGLLSEHFEQAGVKDSGYGYLCGPRGIEEFQVLKVYSEVDHAEARG
ncbi:acyl-CoA reductase-like NAD-dependent aldehyde dehydrogenase [Saccharothrix coeruleofusca]|uniref:aldehyde dehydrogenase family protein n=1 Tax=Saccharothrix coeruleofusca TaxID=33919 RepID=UPI001AE37E4C|nr:aldehyde dehydrogenase family protein [Saccharothrix coeruleofusca]MBP2335579.1 acyl-CoA reductase-like NAD-dependent aldehyde dehydrogenase [Saccharothrix coeruleofusca]